MYLIRLRCSYTYLIQNIPADTWPSDSLGPSSTKASVARSYQWASMCQGLGGPAGALDASPRRLFSARFDKPGSLLAVDMKSSSLYQNLIEGVDWSIISVHTTTILPHHLSINQKSLTSPPKHTFGDLLIATRLQMQGPYLSQKSCPPQRTYKPMDCRNSPGIDKSFIKDQF